LAVLFLGIALLGLPTAFADGEPEAGTVVGVTSYVYYPSTQVNTGTVYSSAPLQKSGQNVALVKNWNAVDVFVTVDIHTTGLLTVTPQFSPDQSLWADAYYLTPSFNSTGTLTTNDVPQRIILSADGTDYIRVPIAGEYMRLKIETLNVMTPSVQATLRNN